jgi:hypothetical protein
MMIPSFARHEFVPWRSEGDRRIVAPEPHWREPLAWNLAAEKSGERGRVLVGCEVFEDWQGPIHNSKGQPLQENYATWWDRFAVGKPKLSMGRLRDRLFDLIAATPHLDWLIATEKPKNVVDMVNKSIRSSTEENGDLVFKTFRDRVWLGVIVSTQAEADARVPAMLNVPAGMRWVWCRGMTEDINLEDWLPEYEGAEFDPGLPPDWLAISSPTGPDAHPTDLAHVMSVVRQCEGAGVPVWCDDLAFRHLPEVGR